MTIICPKFSSMVGLSAVKPVLINIAGISISSFGLLLLLGIIASLFIIWRTIKLYELKEEKILDLTFLTLGSAFIFSRLYFVLFHFPAYSDLSKLILINKYPGLSFWGALIGGFLGLKFFSKRLKLSFAEVADYAIPPLFIAMVFSQLGCLLGGCSFGLPSNLPIAIEQVGIIGKRFPIQFIEALIFLFGFIYFWKRALKFHNSGSIATSGLIFLSLFKFILEFFRGDKQMFYLLNFGIDLGFILSLFFLFLGIKLFYKVNKKSLREDFSFFLSLFVNSQRRKSVLFTLKRNWYNLSVNLRVSLKRTRRDLVKALNIKSNPKTF